MTYPALDHAIRNVRDVGSRAVGVLCYLRDHLAFHEYRTVKVLAVAHATGYRRQHVGRDLRRLTALGYLVRGPRSGPRGPYTYLLAWSVGGPDSVPSRAA